MKFINSVYRPNPSGRLGATVYSKNKYGNYERMLALPSQPRTDKQLSIRAMFTELSRMWGADLTDYQRTMWDNAAQNFSYTKGGKTYLLTGFNFFMKNNRNLQDVDAAVISTVPTDMNSPDGVEDFVADIIATIGSEDITLNFAGVIPAGVKMKVFASTVLKPGRKPDVTKLRQIGVVDSTFETGDSIKDLYVAKFGFIPAAGQKALFAMEPVKTANGMVNAKVYSTAIGSI